MEQLESYGRVITPCLRGQGYSSYYNKVNKIGDFANDLKLFMTEYAKSDNFYIIGHSMGGAIAQKLALLMP